MGNAEASGLVVDGTVVTPIDVEEESIYWEVGGFYTAD